MLLTIQYTGPEAAELGFLLHKNPDRLHSVTLPFGRAHVFYPESGAQRCTAALLLDIDPVGLVRGRKGSEGEGGLLDQYVNDRPYVASSFMSVAVARAFNTAMSGKCKERQELAEKPLPLKAALSVLPCRGGEDLLRRLFIPLGYTVATSRLPLDEHFPEWGDSPYYAVELEGKVRIRDLLTHLYVLIPVLDDRKHYWVGDDEVEKLLRRGEGWLEAHPERELIAGRYLKHLRSLTSEAVARLVEEDSPDPDGAEEIYSSEETAIEEHIHLDVLRMEAVAAELKNSGARRILDLGCGEGKLLRRLLEDRSFTEIVGMDVSHRALEKAKERLRLERLSPAQRERIKLFQGSLIYRDRRLFGYDAAAVVEVVEHLDPGRLSAFERVLFESARPGTVVLTMPNVEYNVKFPKLCGERFRHRDHRFEWTRQEFKTWAEGVAERFGYAVRFLPVGPEDPLAGPPTQMGVFTRGT